VPDQHRGNCFTGIKSILFSVHPEYFSQTKHFLFSEFMYIFYQNICFLGIIVLLVVPFDPDIFDHFSTAYANLEVHQFLFIYCLFTN
jgi:hypothetical protein